MLRSQLHWGRVFRSQPARRSSRSSPEWKTAFGLVPVVAGGFWDEVPNRFVAIPHCGISAAAIVAVALDVFFDVIESGTPPNPSGVSAIMVHEDEAKVLDEGGRLPQKDT